MNQDPISINFKVIGGGLEVIFRVNSSLEVEASMKTIIVFLKVELSFDVPSVRAKKYLQEYKVL